MVTSQNEWADVDNLVWLILETCGGAKVLDAGRHSNERMLGELLARGVDAAALRVSEAVVQAGNSRYPGRFFQGGLAAMPFAAAAFETIVWTEGPEPLPADDVPAVLREMYRVAARHVFLEVSNVQGRDRAWWEARCFEAGFRKQPLYYLANPYEALNEDGARIRIVLEKVPADALRHFDLNVLTEERLLHTDMLRETGRRSDAHCIRYHRAAEFIRPGDRVLDVACGLGYGSHILFSASQARSVLGIDLSDFGIAYAKAHYGRPGVVDFAVGDAQALTAVPDHSIDFIAAFETIEHVPDPMAYLRELKRVLKPAGRVMICAPNDWTDETGKDPNPHHLHVYTWERLVAECGAHFLLEQGFLQTAGGAMKCHHSPRKWVTVRADSSPQEESEWVLLLGMADPLGAEQVRYEETAWSLPASTDFHVSAFARDYRNPWLVKAMVSIGMRARSEPLLRSLQARVQASFPPDSVDFGAALCGRVYESLKIAEMPPELREELEAEIRRYAAIAHPSPHQLRWQVSLLYAGGELARHQGRFEDATWFFTECASRDVAGYSPLLGNKVLDALYWLATFALMRKDEGVARIHLVRSISEAQRLVSGSWLNIVGAPDRPLPFGLAEAAQLLDRAARAAYMLSVLDDRAARPGLVWQESAGFFERQLVARDRRVLELSQTVERLGEEVGRQHARTQELAREVARQDAHAQSLALEVARQDAHAQSLAREVARQDAHAQLLAQEVARQDAHAQLLAQEVARQDAHTRSLAQKVAHHDAHARSLAQEVARQDAHAQSLAQEAARQDAHAQSLARELVTSRAEVTRLQEAPVPDSRPRAWLRTLRSAIRRIAS